jgi:hypothetical protein
LAIPVVLIKVTLTEAARKHLWDVTLKAQLAKFFWRIIQPLYVMEQKGAIRDITRLAENPSHVPRKLLPALKDIPKSISA